LARGKLTAKDREGNVGEELKILVDDAREITAQQAQTYQVTGKKLRLPGTRKVAATAIKPKPQTTESKHVPQRVYVRLPSSENQELLMSLKQVIDQCQGPTEVVLVLGPDASKQIIKLPTGIDNTDQSIAQLRELVGADNLKIQ
jgi:hypothetical protein